MIDIRMNFLIFCLVWISIFMVSNGLEPYELPVVPDSVKKLVTSSDYQKSVQKASDGKFIPRKGWIAVRNVSDVKPNHMLGSDGFIQRNSNWDLQFCDNEMKDSFMEKEFANSSILWAYNILNPVIGTAKVEIWRLAVLYLYGGMYMDDDANIGHKLDDVIQATDKFLVGKEPYDFDDRCYTPDFPLSNHSTTLRFFNSTPAPVLFDNKFFFNWALFSSPGNPLLLRIMKHIVELLKYEYMGDSKIKLSPMDHRGKLLMCATTFPITHAAREMVFEETELEDIGLRVGGKYFEEYGAQMKAWNNDWRPDRWVKQIHKHRLPYLHSYAPPRAESYEGKVIQGKGQREIFLVQGKLRRVFPDFATFVAMGFALEDVHMVNAEVIDVIHLGLPLPYKTTTTTTTTR